jgi:hypothetical protein
VKTPRPAKEPKETKEAGGATRPCGRAAAGAAATSPGQSLSELVEDTSDEVTLGSAPVPAAVFSEVLAEAQAAVNGCRPSRTSRLAGTGKPRRFTPLRSGSKVCDDSLVRIGVPAEYRPHGSEATLDGLARALATLPVAPAVPTDGGSVIVVVGAGRDAQAAAGALIESSASRARICSRWTGPTRAANGWPDADPPTR